MLEFCSTCLLCWSSRTFRDHCFLLSPLREQLQQILQPGHLHQLYSWCCCLGDNILCRKAGDTCSSCVFQAFGALMCWSTEMKGPYLLLLFKPQRLFQQLLSIIDVRNIHIYINGFNDFFFRTIIAVTWTEHWEENPPLLTIVWWEFLSSVQIHVKK